MTLSSELFPAPFGPIRAQISPRATSKLRAVRAWMPLKESETSLSCRMGPAMSASRPDGFEPQAAGTGLLALHRFDVAIAVGRVGLRQGGAAAEQLFAQRAGLVGGGIGAALLQLGHEVVDDILEALGRHGIGEVEAVDVGLLHPLLQDVGDGGGRADEHRAEAADAAP